MPRCTRRHRLRAVAVPWTTVQFHGYGLQPFPKKHGAVDTICVTGEDVLPAGTRGGMRRTFQVRTLPACHYLTGGPYGGLDGWFQGDDKVRLHMAQERWNPGDADTRRIARTLSDRVIEVRDGDDMGWGIIEYGVGQGYERHRQVQQHPPI